MMSPTTFKRNGLLSIIITSFWVICSVIVFIIYFEPSSTVCPSMLLHIEPENVSLPTKDQPEKPILLMWFWPIEGVTFDFKKCKTLFNIDSCVLTADRSLYNKANGVIFYHKQVSLTTLPKAPRPPFQKWIWYHHESPTNTHRAPGVDSLFNLTMSYRRDADIVVRNELTAVKTEMDSEFVLPKKDKLVCWIVSNKNPGTGAGVRNRYYQELIKHIEVRIFGSAFTAKRLSFEDYYSTIASCKFYLSFENSIHRDYISEKLNGPLAAGTVPVVLGPPRQNYEQYVPADSFIHVNDFPNAKALADFILDLDKKNEMYMHYFQWRRFLKATPHLLTVENEFIQPICQACEYMATENTGYSVRHNIYKWYFD